MAKIIGFGGSGHDWAVAAMSNGNVLAAVAEERTSRLKHGIGSELMRSSALRAVLDETGWKSSDVDFAIACDLVPSPLAAPFRHRLVRIRHHLAHAYSAYYGSGTESCAVLVADHSGSPIVGDFNDSERQVETVTGWRADPEGFTLLLEVTGRHAISADTLSQYYQHVRVDNSLGDLYRLASECAGFVGAHGPGSVSDDGKTMGLAAFGDDRFRELFASQIKLVDDGIKIPMQDGLVEAVKAVIPTGPETQSQEAIAAVAHAAQMALGDALVHLAGLLKVRSGEADLALAGGVALNCCANERLARETGFETVFAFPAAGDDGIALGTALYASARLAGEPPRMMQGNLPFFGPSASSKRKPIEDALIRDLVERLASGQIIGWHGGRSEFGPRALGHRSILADARDPSVKERLNAVTKRREEFRPFAPMVLSEHVALMFNVPAAAAPMLPYMIVAVPVRPDWQDRIPAAMHVDGTARVQSVEAERLPDHHRLLSAFYARTGVPALINTSFNRAGEPIVETEADALTCFSETDLDALVIGGRLFTRDTLNACDV